MNLYPEVRKMKIASNRNKIIKGYITDKKVLDLGCVDHKADQEKRGNWLHSFVKKNAKSVVGVDWEKEEVKRLNERGYNVVCGDVEKINLKEKFDVVVAGDIIEHLSNPGMFLENVKKHLKREGVLIITTPNCNNFFNIIETIVYGQIGVNPDHMLWHNYSTLRQLLKRHGFNVLKCYYLLSNKSCFYDSAIKKLIITLRHILHKLVVLVRRDFSSDLLCICTPKYD